MVLFIATQRPLSYCISLNVKLDLQRFVWYTIRVSLDLRAFSFFILCISTIATFNQRFLIGCIAIFILSLFRFDDILDEAELVLHGHYGSLAFRKHLKIVRLLWLAWRVTKVFFVLFIPAKLVLVRKQSLIELTEIKVW